MTDRLFQHGVLSEEEIEFYLKGDRRDVDRLLLTNINRLTELLLSHTRNIEDRHAKEDAVLTSIGGAEAIELRARFVNSLIEDRADRSKMMKRIAQSAVTWALPLFIVFVAAALWDAVVKAFKTKLGLP